MRGPLRETEPVETPPHRAEIGFSEVPCRPLPAIPGSSPGRARDAAPLGNRSKRQSHRTRADFDQPEIARRVGKGAHKGVYARLRRAMAPCPREVSRQIELLRVGTADPAWCINPSLAAAFAHPTALRHSSARAILLQNSIRTDATCTKTGREALASVRGK